MTTNMESELDLNQELLVGGSCANCSSTDLAEKVDELSADSLFFSDLYYPAILTGSSALGWCAILAVFAAKERNWEELFMLLPLTMWLFGNFWWMTGEIINNDDDIRLGQCGDCMLAGIGLFGLYYFVLRPFNLLASDEANSNKYEEVGLHCRFSYFQSWRQYEHFHTLCWLMKDYAWNSSDPILWGICLVPTFLIGIDFIYVTSCHKEMAVDCAHYVAQLFWVLGNTLWAAGELFTDQEEVYPLFPIDREAEHSWRWRASWTLMCSYIPIVLLYCVWIPLIYCKGPSRREGRYSKLSLGDSKHSVCVREVTNHPQHHHSTTSPPV